MKITQRVPQTEGIKGSKKWIQELIETHPDILLRHLKQHRNLQGLKDINWVSPRKEDDFAEYRDVGFLARLGLEEHRKTLESFWPKGGPQWDALGIDNNNPRRVFLVEAKANIAEVITECKAESPKSREQIESSINRVQSFLGCKSLIPWTKGFYQYANRIAHLYFMREIAGIDAFLVFIYFLNDETHIPTTKEQWQGMLEIQERLMDISSHKLQRFVVKSFIDIKEMR